MSTNWGYVCVSHEPNIRSEHWLNHGEEILTAVFVLERAGVWRNFSNPIDDELEPVKLIVGSFEENWPILWLRQHPNCNLVLHNEYGGRQALPQALNVVNYVRNLKHRITAIEEAMRLVELHAPTHYKSA